MNKNTLSKFFVQAEIEEARRKILIFDLHNLVFRTLFVASFAAKKQLMSDDEMWDYWKYLMVNSAFSAIRFNRPDRVLMAIDSPNSWRKKVYADYKGNRKAARDDAIIDFDAFWPIMEDFITQLRSTFKNIYIVKLDECEADDIIAVVVRNESGKDTNITVISSDRDMVQLLKHPNVDLYDPIRKKSVKSLNPQRDLDIKIIAGDKTDNIPSIKKRCAAKTAEKMINEGLELHLTNSEIRANFERNRQLIDFECIPTEIVQRIERAYNSYQLKKLNGMEVSIFLARNGMTRIQENVETYLPSLRRLG